MMRFLKLSRKNFLSTGGVSPWQSVMQIILLVSWSARPPSELPPLKQKSFLQEMSTPTCWCPGRAALPVVPWETPQPSSVWMAEVRWDYGSVTTPGATSTGYSPRPHRSGQAVSMAGWLRPKLIKAGRWLLGLQWRRWPVRTVALPRPGWQSGVESGERAGQDKTPVIQTLSSSSSSFLLAAPQDCAWRLGGSFTMSPARDI